MRYAILSKQFRFEAAHQLPHHTGKCARLHGHSYLLEVSVRGPVQPAHGSSSEGMVLDLDELKAIVQHAVIEQLDHQYLNDILELPTTAENIAHWIWDTLEMAQPEFAALLWRIRLWETATGWVELTREERS